MLGFPPPFLVCSQLNNKNQKKQNKLCCELRKKSPESISIMFAVQQANQTYFFLTGRPPVSVWRRFMHCWFNGLFPEWFWRLLSEKQGWFLWEWPQELSPKSKMVGTDTYRRYTALSSQELLARMLRRGWQGFLGARHVCSYICQMTCIKSNILQIMAAI